MHKELGCIAWGETAQKIHDLVRGVQPWPGAYTFFRGGLLKIQEVSVVFCEGAGKPGEIIELHKEGFYVQAKDAAVLVRRVHPAGGRSMDARSFLAGHKVILGEVLGQQQ
jgi:methionyl-tRNA formyltransferase